MAKFAFNNVKNLNTGHIPCEFNCGYYPSIFFEDEIDPHLKFRSADKLAKELKSLMSIC